MFVLSARNLMDKHDIEAKEPQKSIRWNAEVQGLQQSLMQKSLGEIYYLCYTQRISSPNDTLTQNLLTSLHSTQIELEQRGANVSHS